MTRALLTGGTGFIGKALLARLLADEALDVIVAARHPEDVNANCARVFGFDSLDGRTNWGEALSGIDVVIHAAARVHVMDDRAADPLAEFRKINVEGTLNLARQAAEAGVRRFIFISSIKVNGEATERGTAYTADGRLTPVDPYGISKLEAEEGLRSLAAGTGMDLVIIRPVLVYGPGVKANFLSMVKWVRRGIPLPLGSINNARSLVALDNLVDLVFTCISHPAAANQAFLVSDGEDLSTTELLRRMGRALGRPARLLPIPMGLLAFVARLLGKGNVAQRLCGSLQVDISKTRSLLGWSPPVSVDEALAKTARYFLEYQDK